MALSLYDLNEGKADNILATQYQNGLMSKDDKVKLNGIAENANNYVHPVSHPATMITGLSNVATTGNYNDLINKPLIPTTLPANGGNADTVDGKHADEFLNLTGGIINGNLSFDDNNVNIKRIQDSLWIESSIQYSFITSKSGSNLTANCYWNGSNWMKYNTNYVGAFLSVNLNDLIYSVSPIGFDMTAAINYRLWHEGNQGHNSGMNADLLDGKHAAEFAIKIHEHNLVDESIAGFMSVFDKTKLNGIAENATKVENSITNGNIKINNIENNVYTHPENHSADMITGLSNVATTGNYNDLINKPESLLANGGNADTVGGKLPSDFAPSNFGLGTEAFDVSGQNANNILTTGFYKGLNLNNSCPTGPSRSIYLMVIRHNDNYVVQIGYDYDGNGSYIRFNVNGTWTSWNRQTYNLASVTEDGLMSAIDKTKLEQLVIKVAELETKLNITN